MTLVKRVPHEKLRVESNPYLVILSDSIGDPVVRYYRKVGGTYHWFQTDTYSGKATENVQAEVHRELQLMHKDDEDKAKCGLAELRDNGLRWYEESWW
jgi:hypothetical protein